VLQSANSVSSQKDNTKSAANLMMPKDEQAIKDYFQTLASSKPLVIDVETDKDTLGSTDGKGKIALSPESIRNLAEGLRLLQAKKPLTLDHEKAFATLQHELLHNEAKQMEFLNTDYAKGRVVEAVNELLARHTYSKLIQQAGGTAKFKDERNSLL
jgi:hypothetical protein